ncbi:MAG TPA: type IX secretion system membrane protein PorP/SprF [Flavobacteriales bacterium]|nr:type IX secretion system membrane protein PorP/SprF [Flavobacteriales bacterium]
MSISDKNIDQWLFNYYEGALSPAEVRQLESFLKKNPEYYEDANAWKDSFVEESVPAFDTTALIKDVSKSDRKRFALISFLILFLGSFSALYLTTTSSNSANVAGTSDKGGNGSRTSANTVVSHNTYTNTSTARNSNMSNAVGHTNVYSQSNRNTSPVVMNNHSGNTNPSLNFNHTASNKTNTYNTSIVNRTSGTMNNVAINQSNASVINNAKVTNSQVNKPINIQIYSNLNTISSSSAVTNYQQSPYVAPNQNPNSINLVTNNTSTQIESATIVENTAVQNTFPALMNNNGGIGQANLPTNVVSINSGTPLTINDVKPIEVSSNEMVESNTAATEEITLATDNKNGLTTTTNYGEHPHEVNPDLLLAKNTGDPLKDDDVVISKEKKDIKVENGILFSNLKNVILLQGINNEFETGPSFITQHYQTDGYVGANYRTVSGTGESMQSIIAGYSTTLRKSNTTFNAFGHFTNTNLYRNTGVGLQAAKSIKLDRYNFIRPSIGLSFEQYLFTPQPLAWNCIPPFTPKTYFGSELTGKAEYLKYKSASHVNVSAGIVYHAKKYYLGLSFNGLAQPKFKYQGENNFNSNTATHTANVQLIAGTDFISQKYRELSMSPQVIIEMRNMEPVATGGAVVRYKLFAAGVGVSTKGAINTFAGFKHRNIGIQYRFNFDKLEPGTFGNLTGHYLTTHINLKGLSKKPSRYLDDEK